MSFHSLKNSTSTPLNAGQTFTGEKELDQHPSIMVSVDTDQNGILYIEFSLDGTNWYSSLSYKYFTDRINPPHILEKGHRFYRVRFENNSGSNQTKLYIDTAVGTFNKLTASINAVVAENFDALATRPTNYHHEVAMGKRQGKTLWNKFGYNLDIDIATSPEILASWGGSFDPLTDIISTAQTFTITYNNATDGLGTTGALSILFIYLDENFLSQTASHTLGNTGSDVTTFTGLGINRCIVLSNGGVGFNTNTITVTATSDGTTQAQIPAGESVTQQGIFHTQINHNFLTDWLKLNMIKLAGGGGNPVVTITGYAWSRVTSTRYEIYREDIDTSVDNHVPVEPSQPFVLGGREVLYFTAETDKDNTAVNIRFSGIEERII